MQRNGIHSISSFVVGCILMMAMLISMFSSSCSHSADRRLVDADSIMETHPDSALIILEQYSLPHSASDYDKAMHALLITHARYKNFIDENNDSLISTSADYFISHNHHEEAARALFLKGMIALNGQKFGEAALSFSKGLDLAKDAKSHMWEGQCARGMGMLYADLHDGSAQIGYSKQALEAFLLAKDNKWTKYSEFELASAYNNNLQYDKALALTDDLLESLDIQQDSILISETLQLKGLSLFSLRKYQESINSYLKAYQLNPQVLGESDKSNLRTAIRESFTNEIPESIRHFADAAKVPEISNNAFITLAQDGKYQNAYENLLRYKNRQDSVLYVISQNNVSETINQYEMMRKTLDEEILKNRNLSYIILLLSFLIICSIVYWRLKVRINREQALRLKVESDIESLRSDLLSRFENTGISSESSTMKSDYREETADDFADMMRQKYAEVNSLFDDYYQNRLGRNRNQNVLEEINNIVKDFTEAPGLDKIVEYIDGRYDGLYSSFKLDFQNLPFYNYQLFLFLMLGFNARTISVIFGQDINAIYNKKSRLKSKIISSGYSKKEKYLKFF